MELIAILNRCCRFRRFIYYNAWFSPDKKIIEVVVRPRKGFAAICSRCHQTAPGYDQLAERCFEFIPLVGVSGLPSVHHAPRGLWPLWRCGVEEVPWGDGKRTLTKAYMLFQSPLGAAAVMARNGRGVSHFLG
jgi:transposase